MKKAFPIAVILFLALAFFTGCANEGIKSGTTTPTTAAQTQAYDQHAVQGSNDAELNEVDVPLVDANDSVEIGEMI